MFKGNRISVEQNEDGSWIIRDVTGNEYCPELFLKVWGFGVCATSSSSDVVGVEMWKAFRHQNEEGPEGNDDYVVAVHWEDMSGVDRSWGRDPQPVEFYFHKIDREWEVIEEKFDPVTLTDPMLAKWEKISGCTSGPSPALA